MTTDEPLAFAELSSPHGWVRLLGTPRGIAALSFVAAPHDGDLLPLDASRTAVRATPGADAVATAATTAVATAVAEVDEYLAGALRVFRSPVDLGAAGGIARRAWEEIARIPYGETASYGEIAARIGAPRAARAVGTACAKTPVPLLIPVHRVVRADGTPGPYGGRPELKRALLAMEARVATGAAA